MTVIPDDSLESERILARVVARWNSVNSKSIDISSLDRIKNLLAKLRNPEGKLPPVMHVAGTNGKGSTCAFLRAILEASGKRVHVHTSPHLVRLHETIRLNGKLIDENQLAAVFRECEEASANDPITPFEFTTAATFLVFGWHAADAIILETGMGGRTDATNVIPRCAAAIITPIDIDHAEYLGIQPRTEFVDERERKDREPKDRLSIARHKAGIFKRGSIGVVGPQNDEVLAVLEAEAKPLDVPLFKWGRDFDAHEEHRGRFVYQDDLGLLDLPMPRLVGAHQIENAATAIAALRRMSWLDLKDINVERGLMSVEWPGRLQRLTRGPIVGAAPKGSEVWLDGGHNPHGARAIAHALADMEERTPRPLFLVCGMLSRKDPKGFFAAFRGLAKHVTTVAIPGQAESFGAGQLYDLAKSQGLDADPASSLEDAILQVAARATMSNPKIAPRVLFCGSLYLVAAVLRANGEGQLA